MPPKTPNSTGTPIFSTSIFSSSTAGLTRPTTRDGHAVDPLNTNAPSALPKDRKSSFSRKSSLSSSRRRGSSFGNGPNAYVTDATAPPALPDYALAAAAKIVPRGDVGRDGEATAHTTTSGDWTAQTQTRSATGSASHTANMPPTPMAAVSNGSVGSVGMWQQTEANITHQQITDIANKRIATLDYLRKAYV